MRRRSHQHALVDHEVRRREVDGLRSLRRDRDVREGDVERLRPGGEDPREWNLDEPELEAEPMGERPSQVDLEPARANDQPVDDVPSASPTVPMSTPTVRVPGTRVGSVPRREVDPSAGRYEHRRGPGERRGPQTQCTPYRPATAHLARCSSQFRRTSRAARIRRVGSGPAVDGKPTAAGGGRERRARRQAGIAVAGSDALCVGREEPELVGEDLDEGTALSRAAGSSSASPKTGRRASGNPGARSCRARGSRRGALARGR